ncbi:hypothetical protein LP420_40185 [Massilia sp. B-10]|nr:hypothetical protein LP420_40185 [Massilia sp. B-10]
MAGALAINVGISRAQGKIANNASLTLNADGNTEVRAENEVANTVKASGKQTGGGGVGVGASIALNIVETDTDALIGDNVSFSGAGDITLSADSVDKVETTAEGGSAGDTAVTPVVAISVSDNDTHAEVQGGGVLTLGGTLDASATHEGRIYTDAAGDTESGDTGVGISIALTIGNDNAIATTGRDITIAGAVQFLARSVTTNRASAHASVAGGEQEGDDGTSDDTDAKVGKQESFADNRKSSNGGESAAPGKETDSASSDTSGGSVSVAAPWRSP